ncbi:CMP-N-acetylneuraminate-beta-galactosamide-alpha-2,3-sialyltransferase 4-like [Callorhinchus milii]|uniref:CMP-N-acetylneuraminate-beta-galactosamide- alpha-2,3-sialyltransferase 4-like n=1 Tax=Callorhinchus milii TaxID=7868 RepID=UPI001C3F604E|nr:CMP-N-acetylneuraminate-beta-galactosamide-alpha-2,3-sialyltransferase 4-like [Callorhinchus milii]XP_007894176.2 CMP-N-acetylneuraminate-beta-galactosamide-alpha-2,3-sialyltransferase 4-like [Callorhinchus milii]XP_007894177.2 CMP-N-acetylneuraminate-beta-galactosamide-alpha-2,3-sialyltransferase 4-like [Callorhinchus milii]XP_007894178.2 CMP-N-acetylneuraminate-beta-galactosamide-alpha-2,3-sialyltransferase 4-like [Callorhinchus milii]XP_007894179.2 CMP-N-acetylneuraminate-beta-galactosami
MRILTPKMSLTSVTNKKKIFFAVAFITMLVITFFPKLKDTNWHTEEMKVCHKVDWGKSISLEFTNSSRNSELFLKSGNTHLKKQNLSILQLPYGIKGNEVLINKILDLIPADMPKSIHRLPCKTCVVIGNGYILKNSSLGAKINTYDVVIRINNGPIRGFEKDVGNKTTLRLFYPESAIANPSREDNLDTLHVFVPFKVGDIQWLKTILYHEPAFLQGFWKLPPSAFRTNSSNFRLLNPYYMHQAAKDFLKLSPLQRGHQPTTGFLAIIMALNYCDQVHIAGFGYPFNDLNGLIHYYDQRNMKTMSGPEHNVGHEDVCLRRLAHLGAIKYLTDL